MNLPVIRGFALHGIVGDASKCLKNDKNWLIENATPSIEKRSALQWRAFFSEVEKPLKKIGLLRPKAHDGQPEI